MNEYVPPPPIRQPSGDSGCWKIGAITCAAGCGLLTLVIVIIIAFSWGNIKKFGGSMMKMGQEVAQVSEQMHTVWEQVEKYHKDKGKYPEKLDDLVPAYVGNARELHYSGQPNGPEFTYHKPTPSTQPSDVMLEYNVTWNAPDGQHVVFPVQLMKNGQVSSNSRYRGNVSYPNSQ